MSDRRTVTFYQADVFTDTVFGGNPVACSAALATLDVIRDEGLLENAAKQGRKSGCTFR